MLDVAPRDTCSIDDAIISAKPESNARSAEFLNRDIGQTPSLISLTTWATTARATTTKKTSTTTTTTATTKSGWHRELADEGRRETSHLINLVIRLLRKQNRLTGNVISETMEVEASGNQ